MRSSSIPLALTFALALALAGCASTMPLNPDFQLTGLIELPFDSSGAVRLPATMRYTVPATDRAAGGNGQQFYLVAGAYHLYKYNQSGTFYLGEQPSIVERKPAGTAGTVLRIGGIWIPTNPAAAPKLFILPAYYKPLADNAPVPANMTASNLADFRHDEALPTGNPVTATYGMAVVPATIRTLTPLQAGLAGGAIAGVFALLSDPQAPREMSFVTGDITDREMVRQIRTAFGSGQTYAGR